MKHDGRIAYKTICAAKGGDTTAIKEILRHYERYIIHFCRRVFYDEHRVPHEVLDENRKKQIESSISTPWFSTMIQNVVPKGRRWRQNEFVILSKRTCLVRCAFTGWQACAGTPG